MPPETRVPPGYALVPLEPKPEAVAAWWRVKNGGRYHDGPRPSDTSDDAAYRALVLAAAGGSHRDVAPGIPREAGREATGPGMPAGPAGLVAAMMGALSWSMPRDCSGHPVLGPAIALRERVYEELRSKDFTAARLAADEAAVQSILDAAGHAPGDIRDVARGRVPDAAAVRWVGDEPGQWFLEDGAGTTFGEVFTWGGNFRWKHVLSDFRGIHDDERGAKALLLAEHARWVADGGGTGGKADPPAIPLLSDVAALVAAMREAGVTGDGTWFEQEFRSVERQLAGRGMILPRPGTEAGRDETDGCG